MSLMSFTRQKRVASIYALMFAGCVIVGTGALASFATAQSGNNAVTPNSSAAPAMDTDKIITELRRDIADLKRKVDKPPKDIWDKLTTISGFASAIIVALIGFYATNLYDRRQKQLEEQRKDQEIRVSEIQTVEKLIPHLSSTDEQVKAAALIAIDALGNKELAIKLAKAFGGTGGTSALTTIASTAGQQGAAIAGRALFSILKYLEPRVVAVHAGDRRASGFIVAEDGAVVTTAHLVKGAPADQLSVKLSSGSSLPAKLVKVDNVKDLALLTINTREPLSPLNLSPSMPDIGMPISALLFGSDEILRAEIGTAVGLQLKPTPKVAVRLHTEAGDSGAPVLDKEGRLLGLVQSSDGRGNALLIPAADAVAFVNSPVEAA
jgi:S1-C subfamily serine protease